MTDLQPSWFTADRYSGRSGSVPVPTLMSQPQQAETLDQMRQLAEAQRHRAEMLSRENRSLRESVKRLERMLAEDTVRTTLLEEAVEILQRHDVGECQERGCLVCVWLERWETLKKVAS